MTKMGYKNSDPCIKKAFDDERLFVLMTRDHSAPHVVMEWIKLNMFTQPEEKLKEAFDCAMEMKRKAQEMNMRKEALAKKEATTTESDRDN